MTKTLIHTCCADCALKLIEAFGKQVTLYYYNPNIHPESEWLARMKALKQVANTHQLDLIVAHWEPKKYFNSIMSLNDKTNSSLRCPHCYRLRLEETAKFASEHGYTAFSTTMLTSSYLNTTQVTQIGKTIADKYKLHFLIPKSINQCLHTSGFYKQNYCGCIYSLKARIEEKYFSQ